MASRRSGTPDCSRQSDEQTHGLRGHAVLRIVEVEARRLGAQALAALRVLGEELAQMSTPDVLVVGLQRAEGLSLFQGGGGHGSSAFSRWHRGMRGQDMRTESTVLASAHLTPSTCSASRTLRRSSNGAPQGPAFAQTLNEVSSLLAIGAMQKMNAAVGLDRQSASNVARHLLSANGLA